MGQRPRAKAKSLLIRGRGEVLGTVEPPDEEAAIRKAIDVFGITDRDQQRRRGSPTGCSNIQSEFGMTPMFAGMHGADNPISWKKIRKNNFLPTRADMRSACASACRKSSALP